MKGSDWKALAAVNELARSDFHEAALTLIGTPETLTARYRGTYSGGERTITHDDRVLASLMMQVSGSRLKLFADLFDDDDEVAVEIDTSTLTLSAGMSTISLVTIVGFDDRPIEAVMPPPQAFIEATSVADEVDLATYFTARTMVKPLLTGLHLELANGRIGIEVSNGFSTLLRSSVSCETTEEVRTTTTVQAYDFLLGLLMMGTGKVGIYMNSERNRLILSSPNAMFSCSGLVGTWPDFSAIEKEPEGGRSVLTVSADQVKALVSGAKSLDASNTIEVIGDASGTVLQTGRSETGMFKLRVDDHLRGSYHFDVEDMIRAARLGSQLSLEIDETGASPTLIRSLSQSDRRYWISSRVSRA